MITLTEEQKQIASAVLSLDNFGVEKYSAEDIEGLEVKEDFFHFKVRSGMHPVNKQTFLEYKECMFPDWAKELEVLAKDYGFQVQKVESRFVVFHTPNFRYTPVLWINEDKTTNTYWYRPNQNFPSPIEAFKYWAIKNYKKPLIKKKS